MSFLVSLKVYLFNRKAQKNAMQTFKNLDLKQGDSIADIGFGGGFFSKTFANMVGETGKVYAVEKDKDLVKWFQNITGDYQNISVIESGDAGTVLPKESCDLIFLRNVFHHLYASTGFFKNLKGALKPKGQVVVIDYLPESKQGLFSMKGHAVSAEKILSILQESGFKLKETYNNLKGQSYSVFQL